MSILERLQLRIGSRMDFLLENKQVHISRIEDVAEDKYLLLSAPVHQGLPVILRRDEELTLVYVLDTGRFGISARVVGFKVEGTARLVAVQPHGNPRRQLLRDAYRLGALLKAVVRDNVAGPFPLVREGTKARAAQQKAQGKGKNQDEDETPVTTVDISESGLAFRTKKRYSVRDKLYIRVWLEWPEPEAEPIDFFCEVRRRELINPDELIYLVGVKFLGLDEESRKHLSRYVLVKQQQMLKQQRLMEDD